MSGFDFTFDATKDLTVPTEVPPEEKEISWDRWLQNVSVGIKRQNYLAGWVSDKIAGIEDPKFAFDPNYFFDQDEANQGYDPYVMSRARSAEEAAYMRTRIDQERADLDRIRNESGGAVGEIFGGVFQPHMLVGGWATLGWRGIVAVETGLEVGSELLLHQQQLTRTKEESMANALMVGAGTAFLAGVSKGIESGKDLKYAWQSDKGDVDNLGPGADSAGSARVTVSKEDAALASVGAGAHSNSVFGRAAANLLAWGPRARLSRSESGVARSINEELTDPSFYTKGMEDGTAKISVESEVFRRQGEFVTVMDEVQAIQRGTDLTFDQFDRELGHALSRGDKSKIPEVEAAAKLIRERILEPMRNELIENGVKIGKTQFAKSYFPRVYDQTKILDNMARIKRVLTDHFTDALVAERKAAKAAKSAPKGTKRKPTNKEVKARAAKEARDLARMKAEVAAEVERDVMRTIHNMLGGLPVDQGVLSGANSALKKRTLSLTDAALRDFVDDRASTVLTRYTAGMNPYLVMKAKYGDETLTDQIGTVIREYEDLINKAAGDSKEVRRLENKLASDLRDLKQIRDRILHRVQRSTDPGSTSERIVQFMKNFNIVTQLMGITLSSLPDIARPIAVAGLRSYGKGLARGLAGYAKSLVGIPDTQVRRMGIAVQRTMNDRLAAMADITEAQSATNAQMQKWWGRLTLFNHWTDAMEGVAAHTMMDYTLRLAKKVSNGRTLTKSETMKMARMGFDTEDLKQFYASAKKTGGADDPDLLYADTLEWADIELAKKFEAGIGSQVRRDIVRIGHGDKPLGMDDNLKSLIFQYQSFAIASTNRMLVSNLQQFDRQMVEGVLAGVFLGGIVGATKAHLRGEDPTEWTPGKAIREGIDRSGMLGVYNTAFNLVRNVAGDAPSRYAHRGMTGILGGSTIGQVERGAQVLVHAMEGEPAEAAKDASRLIPFANAMHFRDVMFKLAEDN